MERPGHGGIGLEGYCLFLSYFAAELQHVEGEGFAYLAGRFGVEQD